MRTVYLILNPGSNGGRSAEKFTEIINTFTCNGFSCETAVTRFLDEAYHLTTEACRKNYDFIVAVGGDGTINRVLNGLYAADGTLRSESSFGVIHTGTSPDFCKSYGIPTDFRQARNAVISGKVKSVPVGMVRFENKIFGNRTAFFCCCANIGLGAQLAKTANSGIRSIVGDGVGTFLSLLRVLLQYRAIRLSVTIDGVERIIDKVQNVSIGKTTNIASGIKVTHELTDNDDRLYSLAVHHLQLTTLPKCLISLYSGRKIRNSSIFNFKYGSEFYLHAFGKRVTVEFDGDPAGYLPCTITTAPQRLPLIFGGSHAQ